MIVRCDNPSCTAAIELTAPSHRERVWQLADANWDVLAETVDGGIYALCARCDRDVLDPDFDFDPSQEAHH